MRPPHNLPHSAIRVCWPLFHRGSLSGLNGGSGTTCPSRDEERTSQALPLRSLPLVHMLKLALYRRSPKMIYYSI